MSGASWDDRQDGWWLASNGRWYAPQHYPRYWSRSALPPAPDHRDPSITGLLRSRLARMQHELTGDDEAVRPPDDPITHSEGDPHVAPRRPSAPDRPRTVREAAEATVTSQRTHASRLSAGSPPMPAISPGPPPPNSPPPPGRIRDDAPEPTEPPAQPGDGEVVAGDFGRILGSARSRIEKAINDGSAASSD